MKKKLYIVCALTNLSDQDGKSFLATISNIKQMLRGTFEILEFIGVDDLKSANPISPQEIYEHSIKKSVAEADYMLAICDYPSIGLGYEIAVAVEKRGIPVLAVAKKDSQVTRLIRGIDHKNFHFMYYDSAEDIIEKIFKTLTK
ncbi:MAG: hypothetical protein G01um101424_45 [Parcubacteria group bacterium Gr01-1014_24]|nr:MAG: hypothetical protein G01um101424_45 [Parcubacteria group bacterium Gr01-1014_24]